MGVLSLWKAWHNFEVQHGNEETFREMLRIKRSVQAQHSQSNYMASTMLTETPHVQSDAEAVKKEALKNAQGGGHNQVTGQKRKASEGGSAETNMEALERQAARAIRATQEEATSKEPEGGGEGEEEEDEEIQRVAVPDAVFGTLGDGDAGGKRMGAL